MINLKKYIQILIADEKPYEWNSEEKLYLQQAYMQNLLTPVTR